jgi:hypothetical protein
LVHPLVDTSFPAATQALLGDIIVKVYLFQVDSAFSRKVKISPFCCYKFYRCRTYLAALCSMPYRAAYRLNTLALAKQPRSRREYLQRALMTANIT